MVAICPTDLVDAPVAVVWRLLTNPAKWDSFFDVRTVQVTPSGIAVVGQRVHAKSGPRLLRMSVKFEFTNIDPVAHTLGVRVEFPFGLSVRENMRCAVIDDAKCRVAYGCDFNFPTGWKGSVVQKLMRREIEFGPVDSLARLKRRAEYEHHKTMNEGYATEGA